MTEGGLTELRRGAIAWMAKNSVAANLLMVGLVRVVRVKMQNLFLLSFLHNLSRFRLYLNHSYLCQTMHQ